MSGWRVVIKLDKGAPEYIGSHLPEIKALDLADDICNVFGEQFGTRMFIDIERHHDHDRTN